MQKRIGRPPKDRAGQRFGSLVAVSFSHTLKGHTYWICRCDCGNERTFSVDNLTQGVAKSCGCEHVVSVSRPNCTGPRKYRRANIDLTGQIFGRLLVVQRTQTEPKRYLWDCLCECGNISHPRTSHLLDGRVSSCGCYVSELNRQLRLTHGRAGTSLYNRYTNAKARCNNPNTPKYYLYGGRGIQFLFKSFEEFEATLGPCPGPDYSVDRIDVNGHYEPANVRWATRSQQMRNRRPLDQWNYADKEATE